MLRNRKLARESKLDRAMSDWLRSETGSRPTGSESESGPAEAAARRAEARLTEVFRRMAPPAPSVDLAPAIFARLGLALPAPRRDPFAAWGVRGLILAALVLCATTLALGPALWTALGGLLRPSAAAELMSGVIVVTAGWLAQGLELWRVLGSLAGALTRFATHPPVIAALAIATLVAGGAFQTLNRLISSERSV